ncbi:MAG TPA: GTPase [Tepidisphaeraceae bacterium]
MPENQAILLTPPGVGAIAVVRIAGPDVASFLAQHFTRRPVESRPVYGEIRDGDNVVDDAVIVLLPQERGADINIHGGLWVTESLLQLLRRHNFHILENQLPLHPLAIDANSKLEEEMLTHLPLARTTESLEILLSQTDAWKSIRWDRDFIQDMLSDRSLHFLLHPPRVAMAGAANVGKSTLANQLFAQERSITADLPGTTRDWVGEEANIDGLIVTLIDTPGLRPTTDPIEQSAIRRSAPQLAAADRVLLVLDTSRTIQEQRHLLEQFPRSLLILNKADRALNWTARFPESLRTIATTGEGVDTLRLAIRKHFKCEHLDPKKPRWWTQRQADILQRGLSDPQVRGQV